MQTFKIKGSGPCFGQVHYCMPYIVREKSIVLNTDEWYKVGERSGNILTLSLETGMLMMNEVETDLFYMDPTELTQLKGYLAKFEGLKAA